MSLSEMVSGYLPVFVSHSMVLGLFSVSRRKGFSVTRKHFQIWDKCRSGYV